MKGVRGWSHLRWGVVFLTPESETGYRARMIGSLFHDEAGKSPYPGEPTRALVFHTRRDAREWCEAENAKWRDYPVGHICRNWRMRVVRVRETVTVVK